MRDHLFNDWDGSRSGKCEVGRKWHAEMGMLDQDTSAGCLFGNMQQLLPGEKCVFIQSPLGRAPASQQQTQ